MEIRATGTLTMEQFWIFIWPSDSFIVHYFLLFPYCEDISSVPIEIKLVNGERERERRSERNMENFVFVFVFFFNFKSQSSSLKKGKSIKYKR